MLNESLQSVLDKFTDYSTAGVNLLHVRAIFSVLEKLGFTLDENLPPVELPGLSDLSLFAYLQITEPLPSSNIIVLDLIEFNDLLNRVVSEQLGAFKRSFRSIMITAGQLRKFAHIVVRDPTGFLAFKEPTSASATSSNALPQPAAGQETFMSAFQQALLATIKSIAPPATCLTTSCFCFDTYEQCTSLAIICHRYRLAIHNRTRIRYGHAAFGLRCGNRRWSR